ncbi:DC-STAMP domain-containing protein 2 [Pseudolycoriella hygida]|uniref:DC-STAMP domain-containing protein 2 n=1 Tax=Pseudolycoriella hygida TaxID=35572 RepID=A0A9Q0N3M1_9DIPT|nr:DC-STAMP domain-containing protein 2 [Pseudolycoriella hygida]
MDVSLTLATWLSSIISLYLCFGLAYSKSVQCVTFLLLPQVCSKQGRSMLSAYIFLITLSGPASNIIENIGVLSASLSCGEEQMKIAFREIFQMIKEPMLTVKNVITEVIGKIKQTLLKVRKRLVRIKELLVKIVKNIKRAFNFLGRIVFMCNKKLGSPFQRAIKYKKNFLSKNRYDNKYLNKQLKEFDEKRRTLQMETALPLKNREKRLYVELTSLRLLRREQFRVARQGFFLFTSTMYLILIILTDYSLFWLLNMIRTVARIEDGIDLPPAMNVTVDGEGTFVEIVKGIVDAMTPATKNYKIDTTPCLPSPSLPNTDRYAQILIFISLSWLLLIFEPYGLRLRQIVMTQLYPEKANERAAWLCNQIIRKRISFAKFARRKVRQRFRNDFTEKNLSFLNFLRVKLNRFWIFRKLLGEGEMCVLCAMTSSNLLCCNTIFILMFPAALHAKNVFMNYLRTNFGESNL